MRYAAAGTGRCIAALAVRGLPAPTLRPAAPSIDILRVRVGGWTAEVRGSAIVIPEQRYTNGSDLTDLITCVAIAQTHVPRPAPHSTSAEKSQQSPPRPAWHR